MPRDPQDSSPSFGGDAQAPLATHSDPSFGALLRWRRERAGLSRTKLAKQSKVSEGAIRIIETKGSRPSGSVRHRLAQVAALKLSIEDIDHALGLTGSMPAIPSAPEPRVNWLVAPELDVLSASAERDRIVRGVVATIPPRMLYQDEQGAAAWLACNRRSLTLSELRAAFPVAALSKQVKALAAGQRVQVWALGAGRGGREIDLSTRLLYDGTPSDLWLVDSSFPLLQRAARDCAEPGESQRIRRTLLVADLNDPAVFALFAPRVEGVRIYCLFGGTLGELDSVGRFLGPYGLAQAAQPGDLLAVDFHYPEERSDPLLRKVVEGAVKDWLTGVISRTCPDTQRVELQVEDPFCESPDCKTIAVTAHITNTSSHLPRRITLYRYCRYEPDRLAASIVSFGWSAVDEIHYGREGTRGVIQLFCFGSQGT